MADPMLNESRLNPTLLIQEKQNTTKNGTKQDPEND
jgi:hypothetical protein